MPLTPTALIVFSRIWPPLSVWRFPEFEISESHKCPPLPRQTALTTLPSQKVIATRAASRE